MAHLIYSLTDLESARDDLMFELHKQPQQSPTDNAVSYINNLWSQDYIKQTQPNPTDKWLSSINFGVEAVMTIINR